MSNSNLAIAEKQALMQQVLDQKLSRTELLDLIIHRVNSELSDQIDAIEREEEKLKRYEVKDFIALARDRGQIGASSLKWQNNDGTYSITIDFKARAEELPARVQKQLTRRAELEKQRKELLSKRHMLQNGKYNARIAMIRESLNSTPQGKKILEAIEALKDHVRDNILLPSLPERTP